MNKVLVKIILMLNRIIPKSLNNVIFASFPDYTDNTRYMYEYMRNNSSKNLVLILNNKDMLKILREKNIECYYKNSLKGIFKIITSKYILASHGEFLGIKSKNQIYVNLWHGMPFKKMGVLEKKYIDSKETSNCYKKVNYLIATSEITRLSMAACFNMPANKILVTGQPRNDVFNNDIENFYLDNIIEFNKYKKIIVYIPTFRNGLGRVDGSMSKDNILNLISYDEKELQNFLEKNNFLLLVKLHPREELKLKNKEKRNIKILDSEELNKNLISTNELLKKSDLLITDYSSVYFDYLLTDKPIIFTETDIDTYKEKRGIIYDNPDFWRPGGKVSNLKDLKYEIIEAFKGEYYKEERILVNSMINSCKSNSYSKNVFDKIFGGKYD